ncbi:MAG TPA: hypothetical protein VGP63_28235, partial [Planctomycetaceae bacterium]|nr:hypothetical protein [Planctomycetaceae bacterium]
MLRRTTQSSQSNAAMRPFQTAIGAMIVGCALLGLLALLHEESPIARLVAERATDRQSTRSITPPEAALDDVPNFVDSPVVRPGKDASHFWNASQSATLSTPQSDRGPTIRLGTVFTGNSHTDADTAPVRTPAPLVDQTPLMTRTYRPASMSAVSLERLVRPLLTARGETIATNSDSVRPTDSSPATGPATGPTRVTPDADSVSRPGVLVVSDRPEAIGRIDALCHDLESMSPRVAIDLMVVSVLPNSGRQLPWDQWRNGFGIVESELPAVLNQIRGLGRVTVRTRSQLQAISGAWTELECSARNVNPKNERPDADDSTDRESANASSTTTTTLHIRPSTQSEGSIRIEVRAQSSHVQDHSQTEPSQLVTVRFNTEVALREGATGVISLFVDEPAETIAT